MTTTTINANTQPTYAELGGTGSWCVTGTHSLECTCAVSPGHITPAGQTAVTA